MASVAGLNNFNNLLILLYATRKRALYDALEHKAGRVGLDLRFKGYENINEVLTVRVSQLNGKYADSKYIPTDQHSRPYYGYDAKYDPTVLNAVRNKYVDVSGLLIAIKSLPKTKNHMNETFKPLKSYGVVV